MDYFLTDPIFLIFLSILIGQLIGKISIFGFSFGSSGGLFSGMIIGYFVTDYLANLGMAIDIPDALFKYSLIAFISSVGLIASKSLKDTLKDNGGKFIIISFVITFVGAIGTFVFCRMFPFMEVSVLGTYLGGLTCSPAFAATMETAKNFGENTEALVGIGYAISYVPGVVAVVLYSHFALKKNMNKGSELFELAENKNDEGVIGRFPLISYFVVCIIGALIGKIGINFGSVLGTISLGSTGGVLLSALVLGSMKKVGPMNFDMNAHQLSALKEISLNMFTTIIGLKYGYEAIVLFKTQGLPLIAIGAVIAFISIFSGIIVASRLQMKSTYVVGGICGGMTSSLGLAKSLEIVESDEIVCGYGASYPFALIFMILFSKVLFNII